MKPSCYLVFSDWLCTVYFTLYMQELRSYPQVGLEIICQCKIRKHGYVRCSATATDQFSHILLGQSVILTLLILSLHVIKVVPL